MLEGTSKKATKVVGASNKGDRDKEQRTAGSHPDAVRNEGRGGEGAKEGGVGSWLLISSRRSGQQMSARMHQNEGQAVQMEKRLVTQGKDQVAQAMEA